MLLLKVIADCVQCDETSLKVLCTATVQDKIKVLVSGRRSSSLVHDSDGSNADVQDSDDSNDDGNPYYHDEVVYISHNDDKDPQVRCVLAVQ